jgi:hypothetical protein
MDGGSNMSEHHNVINVKTGELVKCYAKKHVALAVCKEKNNMHRMRLMDKITALVRQGGTVRGKNQVKLENLKREVCREKYTVEAVQVDQTWNFKSTLDLSPVSEPLTKAEKELAKIKAKFDFLNQDTL